MRCGIPTFYMDFPYDPAEKSFFKESGDFSLFNPIELCVLEANFFNLSSPC